MQMLNLTIALFALAGLSFHLVRLRRSSCPDWPWVLFRALVLAYCLALYGGAFASWACAEAFGWPCWEIPRVAARPLVLVLVALISLDAVARGEVRQKWRR